MIRVVTICLAVLAASCSSGPGPEAGEARPAVDTLVSVGDYRLHLRVVRGGEPLTVVFEAGGAADLTSWASVPDSLAARTGASIMAYDRAGLGGSDLGPPDLTPEQEVMAAHRAMQAMGLPERTIVVGHSYGAMLALVHAEAFPGKVGALVLVDPMNPRFVAEVGDWLDTTVPEIADPVSNREHAIVRMTRTMEALSAHLLDVEPRLRVPMWIISAEEPWWGPEDIDAAWVASHQEMAAASPERSRSIATGAAHDVPVENPEAVLSAVTRAVERVRGTP